MEDLSAYLQANNINCTFVIAFAREDEQTPAVVKVGPHSVTVQQVMRGQHGLISYGDAAAVLYDVIYNHDIRDAERPAFLTGLRRADAVTHGRVVTLRRLVNAGDIREIGRMLRGGDLISLQPVARIEPIPILWTEDKGRTLKLANHLSTTVVPTTNLNEVVAGFFCSFGHLVDDDFLKVMTVVRPHAFTIMSEPEFLTKMGAVALPDNTPELPEVNLWAYYLVMLGILGKAADSLGIGRTFNNRIKTWCGILSIPDHPTLQFATSVYTMLQTCLKAHNLDPAIAAYAIGRAEDDGLAGVNRWLHSLFNQALMLLSFSGLQALKLSYEFFESDSSAVWTLKAVAEQGLAVERAWNDLRALPNYPYARLFRY